jgi:hypothetical protein
MTDLAALALGIALIYGAGSGGSDCLAKCLLFRRSADRPKLSKFWQELSGLRIGHPVYRKHHQRLFRHEL